MRWRATAHRLAAGGADQATLAALAEAFRPADIGGDQSQLLVAAGGRVLLNDHLPARPRPEVVDVGTLPHLLPWLAAPRDPRYMLVLIDRVGADVTVHVPRRTEVVSLDKHRYPIERNAPGGWSQRRYQQAAIENWKHNAAEVAERMEKLRRRHGVRTVLVGGDSQARSALLDALPGATRELVEQLPDVDRAEGISSNALQDKVDAALERWLARDTDRLAARFEEESGQQDRAAQGFAAVCAMARQGQVDILLVNAPALDHVGEVWIGPQPAQVAADRDEVMGFGVAEPVQARADAALVRAIAAEDGAVRHLDPDRLALKDGVAAMLRYTARPQ